MKKHLLKLSSIFVLTATNIIAQPTLTATGINPVSGNVLNVNYGNYVAPGNSGANQTWNLTGISSPSVTVNNIVNAATAPHGSSFPGATVAMTDNSTYYQFYNPTSTALLQKGTYAISQGVDVPYSDPEEVLHYPFNYTNTYVDNFSSVFVSGGYTFYRSGTVTVTADGYGTLILPNGTYSNVMRVHFVEDYQDSTDLGGFPYVIPYTNDEYMWYLNGNHYAIAAVYTFTSSGSPNSVGLYLGTIVGINESADNSDLFTTFPSPASTEINILTEGATNFEEYEITSISGANVMKSQISSTLSSKLTLDISDLPSGIYFIELKNKEGISARRKFVITR